MASYFSNDFEQSVQAGIIEPLLAEIDIVVPDSSFTSSDDWNTFFVCGNSYQTRRYIQVEFSVPLSCILKTFERICVFEIGT
jgi:hypothetical protein